MLDNVRRQGAHFGERLCELKSRHSCIREIRGIGLMIGLELDRPAKDAQAGARDRGLLVLTAGETVLRLMPPLTVQRDEIDEAVRILDAAL